METGATPEVLLAHPVAVLAIPAFIPVVGIVLTVLWIARQDRRAAAQEADPDPHPDPPSAPPLLDVDVPPPPRRPWRDRLPRLVIGDDD
jgi:hypothetical protein